MPGLEIDLNQNPSESDLENPIAWDEIEEWDGPAWSDLQRGGMERLAARQRGGVEQLATWRRGSQRVRDSAAA